MQITAVKPFIVDPGTGKNWLFVKVETDSGLYGWGEAYTQADRDRAIEIHIQQLGRYLIGRNPFDIKHFTFLAYNDYANKRGSMECYCAISGLEIASCEASLVALLPSPTKAILEKDGLNASASPDSHSLKSIQGNGQSGSATKSRANLRKNRRAQGAGLTGRPVPAALHSWPAI